MSFSTRRLALRETSHAFFSVSSLSSSMLRQPSSLSSCLAPQASASSVACSPCFTLVSSSRFCMRFASTTPPFSSSPRARQAATAAAAGKAAAAAAKRREEKKILERWAKLRNGMKVGGAILASLAVGAGGLVWFLSSVKRRHPPPPVDPVTALPRPLHEKLSLSPVPRSARSTDPSAPFPNIFLSARALHEIVERYPSFPATKSLLFEAASHVLPIEFQLHMRDAFCELLTRRLSALVKKRPTAASSAAARPGAAEAAEPLSAEAVRAAVQEAWRQLDIARGPESWYAESDRGFFARVNFECEISALLQGLARLEEDASCGSRKAVVRAFVDSVKGKLSDVLVTNWQRQRYFDPLTFQKSVFARRISYEAAGRDVGTPSALYSYADKDVPVQLERCTSPAPVSAPPAASSSPSSSFSRMSVVVDFFLRPFRSSPAPVCSSPSSSPSSSSCPSSAPSPSTSSSSSLSEEPLFLGTHEIQKAKENLREFGVCILRGALTRQQLEVLRQTLHSDEAMALTSAMAMQEDDPNVWCTRPTTGRLHCLLRGTLLETPLAEVQRVWMPLVFAYMPSEGSGVYTSEPNARLVEAWKKQPGEKQSSEQQASGGKASAAHAAANATSGQEDLDDSGADPEKGLLAVSRLGKRIYVSDMQTVDADPLAITQPWHRDTSAPGLTILVPLRDVTEANGPTELLPRSHHLYPSQPQGMSERLAHWKSFFTSLFCETGGSLRPALKAGDVLIYDSRTIHRGLGNSTWHSRPVLAFRYDYEDHPPPGEYAKRWKSRRTLLFGRALERVLDVYKDL
ncbi:Phytanoyl-CoA dioxygenase (PhyH) superfamily protein [Besnoitia besnoiti]|uniref:Phytanoyl-CoA dioxygenase (PhyH) superfamily protein n=1 Tax=Besnoitia besnoiti TaxID=94643 RepID=A0A2A9MDI3_BESBE|nr:Phytanoyl-CoA dioxygenase (PhyH) superfamily protein [Besnoitia besnoiti]PFH34341.1 Phytanoyl-CoA dioxygenase (PhyH) superfamily protein [Besnoitia besnoiti]